MPTSPRSSRSPSAASAASAGIAARSSMGQVGDTAAARDFFAGRYAKVAAETFDAATMDFSDEDVAFAVGALTFLGRVDDAQTCFDGWKQRAKAADPRTVAASRFFL